MILLGAFVLALLSPGVLPRVINKELDLKLVHVVSGSKSVPKDKKSYKIVIISVDLSSWCAHTGRHVSKRSVFESRFQAIRLGTVDECKIVWTIV
jgi:hypothetical protein